MVVVDRLGWVAPRCTVIVPIGLTVPNTEVGYFTE